MQWNSVWNDRCPICGGAVPEGMPPLQIRATSSQYLQLRVCGKSCATQAANRPTHCFGVAERSLQPQTVTGVARALTHDRPSPRRWFGARRAVSA